MVRLELVDPKVNAKKFWEIRIENKSDTVVEYGRIGATPRVSQKEHESPQKAKEFMKKSIKSKTKKGYKEVGAAKATKKVQGGMIRLECTDDGHNKFWQIKVNGCKTIVEYGAIGAKPRESEKDHGTAELAMKFKNKLIGQKKAKGYEEVMAEGASKKRKGGTAAKLFVFGAECSAFDLEKRHDDWCGPGDAEDLCSEDVKHGVMDDAPKEALKVAKELKKAMPDMEDIQMVCSSEGSDGGEVIVISNAGPDAKEACLRALGIRQKHFAKASECATIQTRKYAKFTKGFTRDPDEFEDFDPDDEFEGDQEMLGEYKQELKATKILSKLDKGFFFNFLDEFVVAPVIFGGYTKDGSIVGILSSRVWT